MDRTDPLYTVARSAATQPMAWDNHVIARFQHEMRIDYVEHMPTFDLISTIVKDEDEVVSLMMTLTQIQALEEQPRVWDLDSACGQGRR